MPRCFLAKKSTAANASTHWEDNNNNNNNNNSEADSIVSSTSSHRSTVGSISAAKAVLSIQEPICPPPAHQASILASTASKAAALAAAAASVSKQVEQSNCKTIALHATPSSWSPAAADGRAKTARPPRRKKTALRPPLNLSLAERRPVDLSTSSSSGLTILHGDHEEPASVINHGAAKILPPSGIKIEAEPMAAPLPPEILANIQPHPPSCLDIKPVPTPQPARFRTKEETDAAHDLLELSRSLPPLPHPSQVTLHPSHPPTPPTPDDHQNGQQYTLIYITNGSSSQTAPLSVVPKSEPPCTPPEYPLTPPEFPHDIQSTSGSSSPDMTLSIIDGRTKKSKNPASVSKDKSKYTCTECGKNYATSSNLSRHKQTHRSLDSTNAKKCHVCGKMYVSMPALSMHILTHNLTHRCNVCNKAFSRPWLLQGHMRSHTGHKPYSCTVCKKSFADRSNLRAHMQTHSPSKNFQCSRCHKTFALKSYLNKHYESSCVRGSSDSSSTSSSSSGLPGSPPPSQLPGCSSSAFGF